MKNTATDLFRKALRDVQARTVQQCAETTASEVRDAEERGRREVLSYIGEAFVKSVVGGTVPAFSRHPDAMPALDPLSALIAQPALATPADRLTREAKSLGLSLQLADLIEGASRGHPADVWAYDDLLAACEDEWGTERFTKADRSHLVRKVIQNKLGRRQVVWVKPQDADKADRGVPVGEDGKPTKPQPVAKTREQLVESRTVLANAVSNPDKLNPEQVRALADHIDAITKDEAKGLLKQLGQKVSGDQMAVAGRLLEAIRAGRDEGRATGAALAEGREPGDHLPTHADVKSARAAVEAAGGVGKAPLATADALRQAESKHRQAMRADLKRTAKDEPLAQPTATRGKPELTGPTPRVVNWARGERKKVLDQFAGTELEGAAQDYFEKLTRAEDIIAGKDTHAAKIKKMGEKPAENPAVADTPKSLDASVERGARAAETVISPEKAASVQAALTRLQESHVDADGDYTMVPIHQLRAEVARLHPDITPEEFDAAILDMRGGDGTHDVTSITDRSRASKDQILDSVHAVGEQFFYLYPKGKSESHQRRLDALEGRAAPNTSTTPADFDARMDALDPRDSGQVDVPAKTRPPATDDRDVERYDAAKDKLRRMEGWQADRPSVAADNAVAGARERVRGVVGEEGEQKPEPAARPVAQDAKPVTAGNQAAAAQDVETLKRNHDEAWSRFNALNTARVKNVGAPANVEKVGGKWVVKSPDSNKPYFTTDSRAEAVKMADRFGKVPTSDDVAAAREEWEGHRAEYEAAAEQPQPPDAPRPVADLTDAELDAERRAIPRNRRTPAQAERDRELSKEHARRNPLPKDGGTPIMMGGGPGPGRSGDGDREMAEQTTGRPDPFNTPDAQGRFPSRVDGVSYGDPEDRDADDRAARRHMRQADKHAAEADKIRDQIEALKAAEADRLKRVEERQKAAQQAVTDTAGRLGDAMGKEEAAKAKLSALRGESAAPDAKTQARIAAIRAQLADADNPDAGMSAGDQLRLMRELDTLTGKTPPPAPTGQRQNWQTLRRQAADNAATATAAMNQPHDGSGLPDQPMYASLSPDQRAEFDRQHREAKTRQDARGVAIRAGNIAAGNESARRSEAAKAATNTPPQSPTTGVDNPTTGGNTPPVQPRPAGANQGGVAMDATTTWQAAYDAYFQKHKGSGLIDSASHENAILDTIKSGHDVPDEAVGDGYDLKKQVAAVRAKVSLAKEYGGDYAKRLGELAKGVGKIHQVVRDHGGGKLTVVRKQLSGGGFDEHKKGDILDTADGPKIVSSAGKPYRSTADGQTVGYQQDISVRDPKKAEIDAAKRAVAAKRAYTMPSSDPQYTATVHAALRRAGDTA